MQEVNEKIDNILLILTEIVTDLRETKRDATKMSRHIDSVEEYIRIFDRKFRPGRLSDDIAAIENSLD